MKAERTEAQREASRNNGKNSRGPATPEGRVKSSRNSLKHGLRSNQVVLPGESAEEFNAELTGWRKDWSPRCHTAAVLVERAAVQSWRLRRCVRAESDLLMAVAVRAAERKARRRDEDEDGDLKDRLDELTYGGLDADPPSALAELRATPEGVGRLIDEWSRLAEAIEADADRDDGDAARQWEPDHHGRLMTLLGLAADADPAAAGPTAVESTRLARSNDSRYLADQLPHDEAGAIAARLRDGFAREIEALRSTRDRLVPEPDGHDDGDGDPDAEIKLLGVTKPIMLMHRYEMAIERSMRNAMKDLMALAKAAPGACAVPDFMSQVVISKAVKSDDTVPPAGDEPGGPPAPNEPEPGPDSLASAGPRRVVPGRDRPSGPPARRGSRS